MTGKLYLFLKGILLYTTLILFMFFVMGIESLYDNNILFEYCFVLGFCLILCNKYIKNNDIKKLTKF